MTVRPQTAQSVWTTTLVVDQAHPFYFDHPVDHVPGILQVAGLLGLAIDATDGSPLRPGRRLALALDFPSFAELDEPVDLRCTADDACWTLTAVQGERTVCAGTMELPTMDLPPGTGIHEGIPLREPPEPHAAPEPAVPRLVHRMGAHTVMVGAPDRSDDDAFECAVLRSAALVSPAPVRHPIEVIEAARQLTLMLGHVAYGHPHDSHVLWLELRTDLPAALPSTLPLLLRWRMPPAARARGRTVYRFDLAAADRVLGSVGLITHTVSQTAYQKLRSTA